MKPNQWKEFPEKKCEQLGIDLGERPCTDQGCQFTSNDWISAVEGMGTKASMDGRGRWPDNVFIERLWRSLKCERVYMSSYRNLIELETGIAEWLRDYSHERVHEALDYPKFPAVIRASRLVRQSAMRCCSSGSGGYWRKTKNRRVGGEIRDAVKATMRQMLEAEPDLSDAALARKLTERAKVAISRRTVAKYRMALGIRRQRALDDAITGAMRQNPKATDAELAAMLTASTGKQFSAKVVIWHRLRLGLRKNRPKRHSPAWRAMRSERQRQVCARNPVSEETRRKIAEATKRRWAKAKARQSA